jgi:hypothetical protein
MTDDMDAFERQLAHVVRQTMRPPRPVDVGAIVRVTSVSAGSRAVGVRRVRAGVASTPAARGFSMLSALKLVAAAAVVALCGGFLVLSSVTPQVEEPVPAATPRESATVSTSFEMTGPLDPLTATLLPDGRVLLAGHGGEGFSADLYDPGTRVFRPLFSVPADVEWTTATLLVDGRVLFVGVVNDEVRAWLSDPTAGTVTQVDGAAVTPVDAARLPDGRVLISGNGAYALEIFDPSTDAFTRITGPTSGCCAMAVPMADGRVLLLEPSEYSMMAELYDPAAGSFSRTHAPQGVVMGTQATLLADGRVLFTGGMGWATGMTEATLYDPATGTVARTGPMIEPRYDHTATLLPDGRVLIAGGGSSRRIDGRMRPTVLASAELYDPVRGTFTPAGTMTEARVGHAATLLRNGLVLVVGGASSSFGLEGRVVLTRAELYDPATGTFSVNQLAADASPSP